MIALAVTTVICVAVLFVLRLIWTGGPGMPKEALYEWDWPFTPVMPLSCMGFNSSQNGLTNQTSPLPAQWFFFKDDKGQVQKGVLTPKMGVTPKWGLKKDGKGGWVKGDYVQGRKGTFKDCCNYAIANGTHGAAIFDSDSQLCWTFEHLSPKDGIGSEGYDSPTGAYSTKNLENVFPLWDKTNTLQVINDPRDPLPAPARGEKTYMIPCGGEGMLPCLPERCLNDDSKTCWDGTTPEAKSLWPEGFKSGCSQHGRASKDTGWKGTIPLFRTISGTPLPYSDDSNKQYQVCQPSEWIEYFGYDQDGEFGSDQMPEFNPAVSDFKNARFIPWFDVL